MILDGVSYFAFIQYCRVILSRYSRTLLLSVFLEQVLSGLPSTFVSRRLLTPIVLPPIVCC